MKSRSMMLAAMLIAMSQSTSGQAPTQDRSFERDKRPSNFARQRMAEAEAKRQRKNAKRMRLR